MPGRDTKWEAWAREAAEALEADAAMVEQLTLFEEPVADDSDEDAPKTRGKGKAASMLRDWLVNQGYRTPQEQLVQIAGLDSSADPISQAMARAERELTWAFAGRKRQHWIGKGDTRRMVEVDAVPSPEDRMAAFQRHYAAILKGNEAVLPYVAKKATDDAERPAVQVFVAPAAPSGGAQMRDVTPSMDRRMMPANVRHEIEQKQALSEAENGDADGEARTE